MVCFGQTMMRKELEETKKRVVDSIIETLLKYKIIDKSKLTKKFKLY